MKFLKSFWAILVSLAGVIGLYFAAAQVHLVIVFWIVAASAALLAGVFVYGKKVMQSARRIADYPRLMHASASLQAKVDSLKTELEKNQDKRLEEYSRGREEGRSEAIGYVLAGSSPSVLTPAAIVIKQDNFYMVCDYSATLPSIGARYENRMQFTEEVKGILQVVEPPVGSTGKVWLAVVVVGDESYWSVLKARASSDQSPPSGTSLVAAALRPIETLTRSIEEER